MFFSFFLSFSTRSRATSSATRPSCAPPAGRAPKDCNSYGGLTSKALKLLRRFNFYDAGRTLKHFKFGWGLGLTFISSATRVNSSRAPNRFNFYSGLTSTAQPSSAPPAGRAPKRFKFGLGLGLIPINSATGVNSSRAPNRFNFYSGLTYTAQPFCAPPAGRAPERFNFYGVSTSTALLLLRSFNIYGTSLCKALPVLRRFGFKGALTSMAL